MQIPLRQIKIGKRIRNEMGDIDALADSIRENSLIQPIVVTKSYDLIAGRRRIEACKRLGWELVPVYIPEDEFDLAKRLKAERDENICRKPFTVTEAVEMGKAIEAAYRPLAEAALANGQKSGGGDHTSSEAKERSRATCPRAQDESARTTSVAAEAAGMHRRTYEKAKAVIDSGRTDLIERMEKTGKVDGAYKALAFSTNAQRDAKTKAHAARLAEIRKQKPAKSMPLSERVAQCKEATSVGMPVQEALLHFGFPNKDAYGKPSRIINTGRALLIEALDNASLPVETLLRLRGAPDAVVKDAIEALALKEAKKRHKQFDMNGKKKCDVYAGLLEETWSRWTSIRKTSPPSKTSFPEDEKRRARMIRMLTHVREVVLDVLTKLEAFQ